MLSLPYAAFDCYIFGPELSLDFNYNFNGENVFFIKISNSKVQ